MKYKKRMFILILVIFLFSIAAASAVDAIDDPIASKDTDSIKCLQTMK